MSAKKSLKASSLVEIETAISEAISKITSDKAQAAVISFEDTTSQIARDIHGIATYKIEFTVQVGKPIEPFSSF